MPAAPCSLSARRPVPARTPRIPLRPAALARHLRAFAAGSYLARRADPERCERIVAYPCPAFAAVIYPVLRPLIPEGTGRRVVLLPGEAFADSPCPAGLDEFISLKAIRPDRRPQHTGLSPK
jgi:hypothetical protein